MKRKIYLIGSLRNPKIPFIAKRLRVAGHEVFDDWFAAGPEADDKWQQYETIRGRAYLQALKGPAAEHVYAFDYRWLSWANTAMLVMPAGKSGHLEFGFMIGQGKDGFVLFDKTPKRWDVMYLFAGGVFTKLQDLFKVL